MTPNGTTHAGLQELTKARDHFTICLEKAHQRAEELGVKLNEKLANNKESKQ